MPFQLYLHLSNPLVTYFGCLDGSAQRWGVNSRLSQALALERWVLLGTSIFCFNLCSLPSQG